MLGQYKVIAVTPAGRRCYLSFLIPQLVKYHLSGVLDEYHLWVNTTNQDDINYINEQANIHNNFIKLKHLPEGVLYDANATICNFFKECVDDNTVYIRFDDDIIILDDIDAFKNFVEFRINNPNYFLVFANILNNSIISHIHQRFNNFDAKQGYAGYACMDNIGWNSATFGSNLHDQILATLEKDGNLTKYRFDKEWLLWDRERVSINCVAWLGKEFREITNGIVDKDEEQDIAVEIPKAKNKYNTIFGNYCCVHYAFCTQRTHLDYNGYEKKYRDIFNHLS